MLLTAKYTFIFASRLFPLYYAALLGLGLLVLPLPSAIHAQQAGTGWVSSANPHATRAGIQILQQGGSATDAAIGIQMVLGLVEPQSSGIGGGLFALYWDAQARALHSLDGRETAPAGLRPDVFLHADGTPLNFLDAVIGGRSIGTPGAVAALAKLHARYGQLEWAQLFAPAIALARQGFALSPRLHGLLARDPVLPQRDGARALYYQPNGDPKAVGTILRNTAYAHVLEAIAMRGAEAFYDSALPRAISMVAQQAGGTLTPDDFARYQAKWRAPLCADYRGYLVCSMGPPSSGGTALLQILGILESFNLAQYDPNSIEAIHLFAEASKLAFADRARYLGDRDFVPVPLHGLLNKSYLRSRAKRISRTRAQQYAAGTIKDAPDFAPAPDTSLPSTTHFSVIDAKGNAVSVTSSIEAPFGSHWMVEGFFLNNQLTDFSFLPATNGRPVANAAAPLKRPRSSMTPTIILAPDGKLFAVLGSPGGPRIISYVAKAVLGLIDWQLSMQAAIDLPNRHNGSAPLELEANTILTTHNAALRAMGHDVKTRDMTSGLHGIRLQQAKGDGGADRRREGVARAVP